MLNYAGGNPITAYNLQRSLRFRASASGNLSRNQIATGNGHTYTIPFWVKRGSLGSQTIINTSAGVGNSNSLAQLYFDSSDRLAFYQFHGGTTYTQLVTNRVFRDPSAWYSIIVVYDDTQATAANRVKIYVNGVQETSFATATYPSQNFNSFFNTSTNPAWIGTYIGNSLYFDGYLAEFYFIDGQALTPSSFGSTNSTTGVWQPAPYTGTYGTNGFYLPFTDNSALTTSSNVGLGKDFSGNGNYWTTNNISITSGVTYDSMTDVPTLTSATAANFAVLNPLDRNVNLLISNANLTCAYSGVASALIRGTFGVTSGKWYFEVTPSNIGNGNCVFGVVNSLASVNNYIGADANGWGFAPQPSGSSYKYSNGTATAYGTANGTGTYAIAIDVDAGKIWFSDNTGAWIASGSPSTGANASFTTLTGTLFPSVCHYSGTSQNTASDANFGQRPFAYTPPSGFVALNAYNLPDSTIKQGNKVMDATLYTGNLVGQTITNAAPFQPDLVWIKSRSAATDHKLTDSVRGATKALVSDSTAAETTDITGVVSFNSNGFTLGTSTTYNNTGNTYVAWQWQAGQGTTSTNTNGTITSTVSVNASAGFSIVTYTGTGANATVGHGLGVAPSLIIVKNRSSALDWPVYTSYYGKDAVLVLNTTGAGIGAANYWGTANPTSSVFGVGTSVNNNGSGNAMVAYCFAPIAGYSAFGSYTGNGSADGPFVYCGFKPKYIMLKNTNAGAYSAGWEIIDTARSPYNVTANSLMADSAGAEFTYITALDVLSNGFKIRTPWDTINNPSNIIYMAFASNPFKNSLAQ